MYFEKAAFFDAQVNSGWASNSYSEEHFRKLDLLFNETGDLSGRKILEPGCGTGRLTEILSKKVGENGKVAALDISSSMVDAAKERLKGEEFKNTELFVSQIEFFEAEPLSFDIILCHQVFPHIEDKKLSLQRFYELLKFDGKVIIFHFLDFDEINNVHRKAGTVVEKDMMPENREMERLFKEGGFTIEFIRNDQNGYFLMAAKSNLNH